MVRASEIGILSRTRLLCAGSLLALLAPQAVCAQTTQSGGTAGISVAEEEIVVSASRIPQSGFEAPTPVTVVGEVELNRRAATNISEVLNEVPAFRPTSNPSTEPFQAGASSGTVDLRGLGTTRTLILVDGRRHVATTGNGSVDLNLIPEILVSRMEVVTGGASAAWGSDAVAGVVNVILKNDLNGVHAEAQYGESHRGDDVNLKVAVAGGTDFAGGRGHVLIGAEYADSHGAGDQYTRDWGREERGSVSNPGWQTNGMPATIWGTGFRFANMSLGGLINSGPLAGTAFGPGGTPYRFGYGQTFGGFMLGGTDNYGVSILQGARIRAPIERSSALGNVNYDVSDSVNAFAEVSYATSQYNTLGANIRDPNIRIQADNAFLPASVRAAMAANNLTSFTMGRYSDDIPHTNVLIENHTLRAVGGLKGEFGDGWAWDAYYQYGRNRRDQDISFSRIEANWQRAVDAVVDPRTGAVVCRSTLTDPTNGCVPINLFGNGSPSDAAVRYITGTSRYDEQTSQQVAAVNLRGEPFSTWAGQVSFAVGAEYREEKIEGTSDPLSRARSFQLANPQPISGKFNVKEVYGEVVVPLLSDQPWVDSLDLNAAVRYTDYSTSGGVTTWKVGATYNLNDEFRIRAARSRDIRAPNLTELYTVASTNFQLIQDRFRNETRIIPVYTLGNPTGLNPERADTLTLGAGYRPDWLSGLRLSVDYYKISIKDQIATLGGQLLLDRCAAGATELCQYLVRDAAGVVTGINNVQLNLNRFRTSGFDIEAGYRLPVQSFIPSFEGEIDLGFLATYVDKLITVDSRGTFDRAGQIINGGIPHWLWNGSITYSRGPVSATIQGRYVGGGNLNNLYAPNTATGANINEVNSVLYTNISAQYDIVRDDSGDSRVSIYGVINNVFDKAPPYPLNGPFNGAIFHDLVGRAYRIGIRLTY